MYKLRIGALLATGLLALTVAGTALAVEGHPEPISNTDVQANCSGGPDGTTITPTTGQIGWVFVHSGVSTSSSGTLTVHFQSAGVVTATSYVQGNIKYLVFTNGPDTALTFSDTIDGGELILSHVCYGPGATPTPTPTPSPSASQPVQSESLPPSPSAAPSQSESPSATPSTAPSQSESPSASASQPVESESLPPSPSASTAPSSSVAPSASASQPGAPTPTPHPGASATPKPSGAVLAETATPALTPPATDTISATGGSAGSGLPLVLGALSALLLAALAVTPSRRRSRR